MPRGTCCLFTVRLEIGRQSYQKQWEVRGQPKLEWKHQRDTLTSQGGQSVVTMGPANYQDASGNMFSLEISIAYHYVSYLSSCTITIWHEISCMISHWQLSEGEHVFFGDIALHVITYHICHHAPPASDIRHHTYMISQWQLYEEKVLSNAWRNMLVPRHSGTHHYASSFIWSTTIHKPMCHICVCVYRQRLTFQPGDSNRMIIYYHWLWQVIIHIWSHMVIYDHTWSYMITAPFNLRWAFWNFPDPRKVST